MYVHHDVSDMIAHRPKKRAHCIQHDSHYLSANPSVCLTVCQLLELSAAPTNVHLRVQDGRYSKPGDKICLTQVSKPSGKAKYGI